MISARAYERVLSLAATYRPTCFVLSLPLTVFTCINQLCYSVNKDCVIMLVRTVQLALTSWKMNL